MRLQPCERSGQTLPANRALLMGYELVRPSEEHLRRQVSTHFTAKGALDGDGLKGELPDAGWNVAMAPFADDYAG